MTAPLVSVVLPTYLRERPLRVTLRRLLAQDHPSYEVVVVDQTPRHEPPTSRLLASRSDVVRVHALAGPGLARARNAGVALARGEIVLFVDDDTLPDRRLVSAHAACYASPLVGAVAGRILDGAVPNAPPGRALVTASGRVRCNFAGLAPAQIATAQGANMSFRRRVLAEVGPFDDRFAGTAILEETDYCYRVRALGYDVRFEPAATLRHLRAPSGGCRPATWVDGEYWRLRNGALFHLKHQPAAALPLFVASSAVRAAVRVARRGGRPGAWLRVVRGVRDGFAAHRAPATGAAGSR